MHPDFQTIFVVPGSRQALLFEGSWDGNRWGSGILKTSDGKYSYPVVEGIPNFVEPSIEAWTEDEIEEIRRGNWIQRNWESQVQQMQTKSRRTEFCHEMAQSNSKILEVGSGPGGGNMPGIVYFNSNAKVMVNDLGLRVLQEWQAFLKRNRIGTNVCFAAFDATCMPIRSETFDIVSSAGGFGNIPYTDKALQETFRVLKRGGKLYMADGTIKREDFSRFPEEVQMKWKARFLAIVDGYKNMLENAGFTIVSYEERDMGVICPDESELGKTAKKYGLTLHFTGCYVKAVK